jgi:hypothetical protein
MSKQDEIFKKIERRYKNYSVSNLGNIRNDITNELVKTKLSKESYVCVKLQCSFNAYNERIHNLVAKAFISNPNNHKYVTHLDKNNSNNNVNNLKWYSYKKKYN